LCALNEPPFLFAYSFKIGFGYKMHISWKTVARNSIDNAVG